MQKAQAAQKQIEKGRILPVYVLFGDEAYLRQGIISTLKRHLVPPEWEEMNFLRFDGDDPEIFQLTRTPLFGGEKRLVVVEGSQLLGGTRRGPQERINAVRQALSRYLNHPASDCCLVFDCQVEKADRRLKLVKTLIKQGMLFECRTLSTGEAVEWSVEFARKAGKGLDRQAAAYIVEGSSRSLRDIGQELEKLILFVGQGDKIGLEEARQAGSARAAVIFDLTEALMGGQSSKAVSSLRLLLQQGEPPAIILFMLARQFRLLWGAKQEGYHSKALAGLPRFVVQRLVKTAAHIPQNYVEEAFDILVELDYTIKTGRGDPARALELAVLRLCAGVAQGP